MKLASPRPAAKIVNVRGPWALHAAINGGQVDALQVPLQAGADSNSLDPRGDTTLMAVSNEAVPTATRLAMVEVLCSAGADLLLPNEKSKGRKAIQYAAQNGDTRLVGNLLSRAPTTLNALTEDEESPLLAAACSGHEDTVFFSCQQALLQRREVTEDEGQFCFSRGCVQRQSERGPHFTRRRIRGSGRITSHRQSHMPLNPRGITPAFC